MISLFLGGFCGAQRHVWVGLVVLWGVEQEDGGGRFENLRGKCNSPQVKIFPGGVAGVGGVCGKGKVAGVVVLWCL